MGWVYDGMQGWQKWRGEEGLVYSKRIDNSSVASHNFGFFNIHNLSCHNIHFSVISQASFAQYFRFHQPRFWCTHIKTHITPPVILWKQHGYNCTSSDSVLHKYSARATSHQNLNPIPRKPQLCGHSLWCWKLGGEYHRVLAVSSSSDAYTTLSWITTCAHKQAEYSQRLFQIMSPKYQSVQKGSGRGTTTLHQHK